MCWQTRAFDWLLCIDGVVCCAVLCCDAWPAAAEMTDKQEEDFTSLVDEVLPIALSKALVRARWFMRLFSY